MKLVSRKKDFEERFVSSGISSLEVSDEEECDEKLEAKVKATKVDATLECEDCEDHEEVTLEVEGFCSSLGLE